MICETINDGATLGVTAASDLNSGDVVVTGTIVGIVVNDTKSGERAGLSLCGAYRVTKAAGTTFSAGDSVYWNATDQNAVAASSGNSFMGRALEDAASGDERVAVRLEPAAGSSGSDASGSDASGSDTSSS